MFIGVTGFEPATSSSRSKGSSIPNTANTDHAKPNSPVCTPVCTSDAEDEHGWISEASEDSPELMVVVEAWPLLPQAVKAGILAMVRVSQQVE